jgi:F-type H+-transporting ATPase subunit gamma
VASSKLHHAQQMIENMLPYENMLEHILKTFIASEQDAQTTFDEERKSIKGVALVVFTSNSSLCGAFNVNVIKMMDKAVEQYKSQGVKNIVIYPIGRKVEEQVKKRGLTSAGSFDELAEKPNAQQCQTIARELGSKFMNGEYDHVELIYHHFKSAGSQILTRRTFLPIDLTTEIGSDNDRDLSSNVATLKAQEYLRKKHQTEEREFEKAKPLNDNFLVEPDLASVLKKLIPLQLRLMVYTALLDSNASEHAARMVAMQTATDNADDILKDLNLQYNKSRQQAITNELLDIVAGTVNN